MPDQPLYIDNLQYANWSPALFEEMKAANLAAVHITICYHENFRQTVENIITNAEEITGKVGEYLREGIEQLKLSQQLTTIKKDVELDFGINGFSSIETAF